MREDRRIRCTPLKQWPARFACKIPCKSTLFQLIEYRSPRNIGDAQLRLEVTMDYANVERHVMTRDGSSFAAISQFNQHRHLSPKSRDSRDKMIKRRFSTNELTHRREMRANWRQENNFIERTLRDTSSRVYAPAYQRNGTDNAITKGRINVKFYRT